MSKLEKERMRKVHQKQIKQMREHRREKGELMELQIATKKAAVGHKLGIGIVAKQFEGRIRAEWTLVDRSSQRDIQDEAVAVRLALMKARQQSWQRIKVTNANKQLIALLRDRKGDNPNTATLMIEDIHVLANLFQMCSFEVRNDSNMTLCNQFSHYALNILMDGVRFFGSP